MITKSRNQKYEFLDVRKAKGREDILIVHVIPRQLDMKELIDGLERSLRAVTQPGMHVVINFSKVRSCDSSALESLVRIEMLMKARGKTLKFVCATQAMKVIFAMTGFVNRGMVTTTLKKAINSIKD